MTLAGWDLMKRQTIVVAAAVVFGLGGCAYSDGTPNSTATGATIGALGGVAVGSLIGGDGGGAVIGGVLGAGTGAVIGARRGNDAGWPGRS